MSEVLPFIVLAVVYVVGVCLIHGLLYDERSGSYGNNEAAVVAVIWPLILAVGVLVLPFVCVWHLGQWMGRQ